jgi:hypothetical protein
MDHRIRYIAGAVHGAVGTLIFGAAACGGPLPAAEQPTGEMTSAEFEAAIAAEFDTGTSFDATVMALRESDRLPSREAVQPCATVNDHFAQLRRVLSRHRFETAYDGAPDPTCSTWVHRTAGTDYRKTQGSLGGTPATRSFTVHDVVRICVHIQGYQTTCRTSYVPFSVRLIEPSHNPFIYTPDEDKLVRLPSAHQNKLSDETLRMVDEALTTPMQR